MKSKSEKPKIFKNGYDLHQELSRRGLQLNPDKGRDKALYTALAKQLELPCDGFAPALQKSNKSAQEYLQGFVTLAQPFAQMFQKIWSYLSIHCAPKADESLLVRFGFEDDNPTDINWDQFRLYAESAKKIWASGSVIFWPRDELFHLGRILSRDSGPYRNYSDYYERGKSFNLPKIMLVTPDDRMADRVREAIQSWIEAIHLAWPLDRPRNRELPELQYSGSNDEVQNSEKLIRLSYDLTDLIPVWRHILDNWNLIPLPTKATARRYFEEQIVPKLGTATGADWQSLMEALDILDLPFWRHRWHTYEVWAAVTALEALDEFCPKLVVKNGHVALDAASPALIATLSAVTQQVYAHAQGETKLSQPLRKRKAIKPDLRFSIDNPASNAGTVAIVEFKQRLVLDADHVSEVLTAYSRGVGLGGGVVLINYDAAPSVVLPPSCTLLGDVHPGRPTKVQDYQMAVRSYFTSASIRPQGTKRIALLDVSGSMESKYASPAAQRGLRRLLELPWIKVFRFNDGLVSGGDLDLTNNQIATSGGTELGAALRQLFDLREIGIPERLLIITDGGHDHPNELLAKAGEHTECTPEKLEDHLDWLSGY